MNRFTLKYCPKDEIKCTENYRGTEDNLRCPCRGSAVTEGGGGGDGSDCGRFCKYKGTVCQNTDTVLAGFHSTIC